MSFSFKKKFCVVAGCWFRSRFTRGRGIKAALANAWQLSDQHLSSAQLSSACCWLSSVKPHWKTTECSGPPNRIESLPPFTFVFSSFFLIENSSLSHCVPFPLGGSKEKCSEFIALWDTTSTSPLKALPTPRTPRTLIV